MNALVGSLFVVMALPGAAPPVLDKAPFKGPPYARPAAYREVDVVVGKGGNWPLPGTLTLPVGEGPFPVVVLVHGSGPADRDETLGPNKPFRDLAWGLASQNIAVLRYVKRTRQHGLWMVLKGNITIKEETIDDAVTAVALLRTRKEIDPRRVFVVGHSLGAFAAPKIGSEAPEVAGLVMLAGNSRPLEELLLEQYPYLISLKGKVTAADKAWLERSQKQLERVKQGKFDKKTPNRDLPLGLPASYWLALKAYDAPATAAKLKKPMLVLQGERDYQVTLADFNGWKKALVGRRDVTFKSYPALHHLFMVGKGKGKSVPAEYYQPDHVAREVVDDVASWIKKH
jgi:uncharacterized protein